MTAHQSQGISIHYLCRNNKSEKYTITNVKFKRGTTEIWRSWLQLSFFLTERVKSLLTVRQRLKDNILKVQKGRILGNQSEFGREAIRSKQVSCINLSHDQKEKQKAQAVRLQRCAVRQSNSIIIMFALFLHFSLSIHYCLLSEACC